MRKHKLDKLFFHHFWQLFKPYWTSEEKWSGFALLGLNILCMLVNVWAGVGLNTFSKEFYDALQNFDRPALMTALIHFAFFLTVYVLSACYAFYFNGSLGVRWRRWLTQNYLKTWLSEQRYYHMRFGNNIIDNPDQRLSEDLDMFPNYTLAIFFMCFQSFITLITYGVILWGLSDRLDILIGNYHLIIPNYLFFGALLYGISGLIVTNWMGRKLVTLDYQQQYYNADYRYAMVRLRESSEQVALYRAEKAEHERLIYLFKRIFKNVIESITLKKHLMFFTNSYNNIAFVFGILMATPLYLQRKIQLGSMMQISGAAASVANSFVMLVNMYTQFAEWKAVIFRLGEFKQSMSIKHHSLIAIVEHQEDEIIIENLTLHLPGDKLLAANINFTLPLGERVLLQGPSGCGKSTLLRAIAGLWYFGEGKIYLPKNKKIFFLPQKSYLPVGSLQDCLLYPHESLVSVEKLQTILSRCGLDKFQNQLAEIKNWSQELSLGEQQLIAFARVFLHQPDIIFLDEASSALDERAEEQLYQLFDIYLPSATIISIGHRASLKQFHALQWMFPFAKKETCHLEANKITSLSSY